MGVYTWPTINELSVEDYLRMLVPTRRGFRDRDEAYVALRNSIKTVVAFRAKRVDKQIQCANKGSCAVVKNIK